jgi:hypothetical protein
VSGGPRRLLLVVWMFPLHASAQLSVPVEREELSGAIAGRVCVDLNRDGRCAADEPGYPNLRLVLETGQQVITDRFGRYHLARVGSRVPEAAPLRLRQGRHRLRVDARTLPPETRVLPEAATLELPMGALVVQDFAVQELEATAPELKPAHGSQPPAGRLGRGGSVQFEVSGQATPGARVQVERAPVAADASGRFRAVVQLERGANEIALRVDSPGGTVRLYSQRIDVIERPGGALVVPREIRPRTTLKPPASREQPAAAGPSRVRVEAVPGTVIAHPAGQTIVGPDGFADLPLVLVPGMNVVPLVIESSDEPPREERLEIAARARSFVAGLLDLEATLGVGRSASSGVRLFGRGAAHAEMPVGRWLVEGEVDLRDDDVSQVSAYGPAVLALPRNVLELERAVDPERVPGTFADQSTSVDPNVSEGRLRIEARHPEYGRVGYGTYRAQFAEAEVGRYHRSLLGAFASLQMDPRADVGARVEGFASPGNVDLASGLHSVPAHAEFLATGGSFFQLPQGAVARGSERVRVVVRDGLTGLPLAERHLVLGVDYELDAASGRLLLASPLSLVAGAPLLLSDPPTASAEPVLVVDYERLQLGGDARSAAGAEASGKLGPLRMSAGAAQEAQGLARYRLVRGSAGVMLGPLLLSAEGAQSSGAAHGAGDVAMSDDGGLGFAAPAALDPDRSGWAVTARLRGPTLPGGRIDASYRRRTPGYSDAEHDGRGPLTQVSALVEQALGPVAIGASGDGRTLVDPREPFGRREIAARTVSGYVAYRAALWDVRLEGRDLDLVEDVREVDAASARSGRTSLGIAGRYRLHERLVLRAGQRFVVATRGQGAGAFDDTFSSVGAEVELEPRARVGLHGGWGPKLGPLAWLTAEVARGSEIFYGSYSVDVDGPDFGERRAVSGARTKVADGTVVFVEDVSAHDAGAVRVARAVGASLASISGLELSVRYERGVRHPLDAAPPLRRDAGGIAASWVREGVRLYARGEMRYERGRTLLQPALEVDRVQRLASAAASWEVARGLQLSGRLNWSETIAGGVAEAAFLEASAGMAWRIEPAMVVLHYGMERELGPRSRGLGERTLRRASLMPSVRIGERVSIAAGAHLGWSTIDGNTVFILSGSLRPSVRVVGNLEVAAEVARRSAAPDGGDLNAVRGEVGYRFGPDLMLAAGYSALGFTGLGLTLGDSNQDRLYLRGEAAW